MAKRFISTDLFDDSWFMDLSPNDKLFFIYLITNCDHAGIIDLNLRLAEFKTGIDGLADNFDEIKQKFGTRLIAVRDNYFFIPKFIKYQYPNGLSESVKAQQSVIKRLSEFGLYGTVCEQLGNSLETVKQQLAGSCLTPQDKDKDKDKDKDSSSASPVPKKCGDEKFYVTKRKRKLSGWSLDAFNLFWEDFNYKKGRADAADAWLDILDLNDELVNKIRSAARAEAKRRPGLLRNNKIPKFPQGWLSSRRWEDEQEESFSMEINGEDLA